MIFEYQLFLGFPATNSYLGLLDQLPSEIRSVFIRNDSDYLQQIEFEGQVYLGKDLGSCVDLPTFELTQNHIYSLLKRLIASYPYENHPLILLAIKK